MTPKYIWASGVCPQKQAVLVPLHSQKWPETKPAQDVADDDANHPCQALQSGLGLPHKTQNTPETRTVLCSGPGELTLSSRLSQTCVPIRKQLRRCGVFLPVAFCCWRADPQSLGQHRSSRPRTGPSGSSATPRPRQPGSRDARAAAAS